MGQNVHGSIEAQRVAKTITFQVIACLQKTANNGIHFIRKTAVPITTYLPVLAGILFVAFLVANVYRRSGKTGGSWIYPACLSLGFLIFSLFTAWTEGPTGFWVEHTRNLWGNQIWFDLLMSTAIAWLLMVPQAKALGMRLPFWLVLVVSTGNIGFMAMLARLLWLRERSAE